MSEVSLGKIKQKSCEICHELFTPDGRRKLRCAKLHERECENCGVSFVLNSTMKSTKTFCSYACSNGSRVDKKSCVVCGEIVSTRAKTCSNACATKLRNSTVSSKTKHCEWCGEEFAALSNKKYCEGEHFSSCEVCSKTFLVDPYVPRRTCSAACAGTIVNSPESNELRKETSLRNWGTDFPQQSVEIKDKISATNLKRYGAKSPLGSSVLRAKGRETSLRNWGAEWHVQSPEGQAARIKTNLERYGFPNTFMVPEFIEKARAALDERIASGEARPRKISLINQRLKSLIEEHFGVDVTYEQRFGRYSADLAFTIRGMIYLLDIHPTVSHNSHRGFLCMIRGCDEPCKEHNAIDPSYHLNRAKAALKENQTLIQWYGWESDESLLKYLGGKISTAKKLSARKLELRSVPAKEASEFLEASHIQGTVAGQPARYGLYSGEELISLATFGPTRFGAKYEWEFIRYATKSGYVVHGASGKLFEAFLKDKAPSSVVSYVDFNHTTKQHTFLQTIGFEELSNARASLMWHRIADNKVVRNTSVLSLGADRLIGTNYGPRELCGLDNNGIMLVEGFLPVYTAGNRVFVWNRNSALTALI